MFRIDINCDMGEDMGNDELIMPYVSSASIACGYHSGNEYTMQNTVDLCIAHHVSVGAHPSFNDRENFGRREMNITAEQTFRLITEQLEILSKFIKNEKMHHVKPHGALYNMAAKDRALAEAIALAVKNFDKSLVIYGLAGSFSISEAQKAGLKTASEVFADRTYQDDGTLTSRTQPHALIENTDDSVKQVLQMIRQQTVTTISGKEIPITAETICIHGDGKNAVAFARTINQLLNKEFIEIKAI